MESSTNYDLPVKIPPNLKLLYTNFKLVTKTSYYYVLEATSRKSFELHAIRILDTASEFVNKNFDRAATLFIQELLHLQSKIPGSVFPENFNISENGKQIVCITRSYVPENRQFEKTAGPKKIVFVEKLIKEIYADVEFLWKNFQSKKILESLQIENISYMADRAPFSFSDNGTHFLSDWANIVGIETEGVESTEQKQQIPSDQTDDNKPKNETMALGGLLFINNSAGTSDLRTAFCEFIMKSKIYEGVVNPLQLQSQVEKILSPEKKSLNSLLEAGSSLFSNMPGFTLDLGKPTQPTANEPGPVHTSQLKIGPLGM